MGRGKGGGGHHRGRGNNNGRAWRDFVDEINHVLKTQDMAPMIQSQIHSINHHLLRQHRHHNNLKLALHQHMVLNL